MIIKIADKFRRELYRVFHPSIWGKNTQINGIPRIYDINHLELGRNVSVNEGCVLQCYGGLQIGNNVTISDGAKILTRSLDISDYSANASCVNREHVDKPVTIGDGTWIAVNAVILPGVNIPSNCIIAANSVVTRSLDEDNCLYAGVPARKIRELRK